MRNFLPMFVNVTTKLFVFFTSHNPNPTHAFINADVKFRSLSIAFATSPIDGGIDFESKIANKLFNRKIASSLYFSVLRSDN